MPMTRFFDNTVTTKFVKYLLCKSNIPIIPFWYSGRFVKEGGLYIYKQGIYYALRSGSHTTITLTGENPNFRFLCTYVFSKEYKNITTRFTSNTGAYDAKTHYYLGEYLRTIQAYYNINLMHLYNCFCGTYVDDVNFGPPVEDSDNPLVKCGVYNKTKAPLAKVFSVPIKFGKTYSVAIDCDTGVEVVPVFYGEKGLNEKWTAELLSLTTAKYRYFESGHFQRADIIIPPIEWEDQSESGASKPQYVGQYERQLCLLVKVPASNTSSFVVLEGDGSNILDYRTSGTYGKIVAGYDFAEQATNVGPLYDKVLTPKLLWFNDKNIYAFSDTLIQWLLLNVISNADDIDKNITRVQQYISSSEFEKQYGTRYTKPYQKSVWNADMQEFIMKVILSSNSVPKIDRSGYVDRVNETMITKGQKV